MSNERTRILDMLKQGKITIDEAEQLLDALGQGGNAEQVAQMTAAEAEAPAGNGRKCKFLRVSVKGSDKENVDIRVPMQLLRAGVKLGALIPPEARGKIDCALGKKGINLDLANLTPETVDELIEGISGLSVDVAGDDGETVKIFCE